MTKKDYVLIASEVNKVISRYKGENDNMAINVVYGAESVAKLLALKLEEENPKFDRVKFLTACGVTK
ncbi:MAG: hypothetical protein WCH21_10915 [Bacteroidota bacterium]